MDHHGHHTDLGDADPAAGATVVVRAGGNRLHVAIQALALENARLRAELACYRGARANPPSTRFE
jgi:hypothetical protein